MKVGYLGPRGTFTESALNKYVGRNKMKPHAVSASTIMELFLMLEDHQCDEIIVPIENSVEGSVNPSLDMFLENQDIVIKDEVILPVRQCLLAKEPYAMEEITDVYSHPQALAQCHKFLHAYPKVVSHSTTSTAIAATMAARDAFQFSDGKTHRVAVIGSQELARIYGLQVLQENINDYKNNTTRFVVLSRATTEPTGNDKTSIVFATKKDEPGSLYKILGEFAKRGVNLTRIYSRPTKNVLGEYLFYLDLEGHRKDAPVAEALQTVQSMTSTYQWLGSYPRETDLK